MDTTDRLHFPGRARLIQMLDAAFAAGGRLAIVEAVRAAMAEAIADPGIQLPAIVHRPVEGHYARRELHRSPAHGYSLVAMTWAPGQSTPLHDHDGRWCVEGVWHGALRITRYALLEDGPDGARFLALPPERCGVGSTGALVPPHEHHVVEAADGPAVSLHVYEAALEHCASFEPAGGDRWRRAERALATDDDA